MTQINEPYYDTDPANKAYVDKVNGKTVAFVDTKSKNFGIQPEPPYHVNDTYMDGTDIYICIKDRELGSFDSSDWKLASTYTNNDVANSKNKVFITQPAPPYTKGDLWTTGPNGELRRCINSRATGSYVESDWENATSYDNTHTVIENGLVTAGTIQVVNGGTVAAGMTGNESGDNAVRFWSGATSGNKNNAPFRVTQKGYLYASDANISGTITATSGVFDNVTINNTCTINGGAIKTGTIAADRLDSSVITTNNFSAQNINASKITSGTLSTDRLESKVITTDNFSAQNINADKITAGTLSAANVSLKNVRLTPTSSKIGGWTINANQLLSANSTGNSTINSNGEIYFYPTSGGILGLNNGFRCKAPSGIAIYNSKPNYGTSDNIKAGISIMGDSGNVTIGNRTSANSVNIRSYCSENTRANPEGRCILLASASNTFLWAGDQIWAEGGGLPNSEVMTKAGSSSSRNVKTNFKKFNQDKYDKALSLLNKMNLYDYDYKYNIYKNPHKYGFIIDELEQLEETKDFFEFEEYNATIKDDKIDFSGAMEGEKLKTKNYDSDVLDKYLLTCIKALQNKIDKLEDKIKLLEGGNQYE